TFSERRVAFGALVRRSYGRELAFGNPKSAADFWSAVTCHRFRARGLVRAAACDRHATPRHGDKLPARRKAATSRSTPRGAHRIAKPASPADAGHIHSPALL